MKDFWKVLRVYYGFLAKKKLLFVGFLLVAIIASIEGNINPYFYKRFVDAIPGLNYKELLNILLLLIFIRFLGLVFNTAKNILGDYLSFHASIDARVSIFKKIQDLDFAFHSSKSTGSLISAFKRGDGAFFDLYHAIHDGVLDVIVSFVIVIYFFRGLDTRIVWLVLTSLVLNIFISRYLVKKNIKARDLFNDAEDEVSRIIVDNMINYETVKLFAKEEYELTRLKSSFKDWVKNLWKYASTFRVMDISVDVLVNITTFLILLWGLGAIVKLELTVGEFILVIGFMSTFGSRLFDVMWKTRQIAKSYADIKKYFSYLDYDVEIKDPTNPTTLKNVDGEIEFKNVTFSYKDGKQKAIKNLSLHIRQGQSVALVGRSGSGKTTITKILMRFFDIDKGEILIDKTNIKKFTKSYLRSLMGVVPQEPIMFNNTIGYNIGYGKEKATQKEIEAAAKLANLHDFILTLPKKYKTNVGERGIKLSGGQKQRLAIARMILSDPEIVIFDEATSHLDSENEKMIQEAFWKAVKNKTTIIIAHRLSTAMNADNIIVLEDGQIVESGSHQALMSKEKSLYKYFWSLQTDID